MPVLTQIPEFNQSLGEFQAAIAIQPVEVKQFATLLEEFEALPPPRKRPQTLLETTGFTHEEAAYSNLLYTLAFCPGYDARAILEEHRLWSRRYAEPLARPSQPHPNDRSPHRRLRIGYVSPDFRDHAQSFFTAPLLIRLFSLDTAESGPARSNGTKCQGPGRAACSSASASAAAVQGGSSPRIRWTRGA